MNRCPNGAPFVLRPVLSAVGSRRPEHARGFCTHIALRDIAQAPVGPAVQRPATTVLVRRPRVRCLGGPGLDRCRRRRSDLRARVLHQHPASGLGLRQRRPSGRLGVAVWLGPPIGHGGQRLYGRPRRGRLHQPQRVPVRHTDRLGFILYPICTRQRSLVEWNCPHEELG
uniref:Uncharacterized protein n=1 Tax=uncultured marine group II/III euryarchaeote KM3_91_B08 TaxID=1456541 RepID=A0A075HYC2_9EURY|nr:hypothetical protein [uncultured marine group II/III euryarchaeote KM3_91_B08]